jgi:hypothetical protein
MAAVPSLLAPAALAQEDAEEDLGWPREIEKEWGMVVIYQPQLDSVDGDDLAWRSAVSVTPAETGEPVFGAAWVNSRMETDMDNRIVTFREIQVPRVHFPDATSEQEQQLADLLVRELQSWDLEMSLDRLLAVMELAETQSQAAEGFDDSPPMILFSQEPAVLVSIDGPPQLREVEGSGVKAVVNAPFLIVEDPEKKGAYYLYAGAETWYTSKAVEGPWSVAGKVPDRIRRLQPEEEEVDAEEAAEGPSEPPAIVVATEPTELIVTEGKPAYAPIADGELLVVTNTESDMVIEVATQRTFLLISGRWFAARTTDGPWQFVPSDELPESFADIDPDSDYGYLLTWVAGTEMAEESVLDSYVPQTAAVKVDASITVTYDGEPQFTPIEETELLYAVNTESQVIQVESEYYCAEQGVWYVATNPKGPWRVAIEVPEIIYTIPPSNPNYNVTYVHVYQSTPEVVYVGYYPGYMGSYHYHGCLVYGTGWYYNPWWSPYHYYPRYRTWGFHVRWNPWYGWSFGLSFSTGRFTFGIGVGGWGRRGWWGPGGYRGYRRGYNRGWHHGYRQGARAGYRAGQRDSARNLYQRGDNASRVASNPRTRDARGPTTASGRPNNVYTDKNGNVFRQQSDGSWQQREGGQWNKADMGEAGRSRADAATGQRGSGDGQRPSTGAAQRPSGTSGQRPSGTTAQKPSTGSSQFSSGGTRGGSSLNNDARARQRGNQRSQSFSRSGGGARRGGGGGRRR